MNKDKQIEALKLKVFQLERKIEDQTFLERIIRPKLENIRTEIADRFRHKSSGQSVVMNFKDGKFCDPIIVGTTDVEEALCPEDESYQRAFCMPIMHADDFKEF